MKYVCETLFDITETGITGHCRLTRLPMKDLLGRSIANEEQWNRARNQQRNWETLQQILSLRTQITVLKPPMQDMNKNIWMFEFEPETVGAFGSDQNPTEVLLIDADRVPMLRELDNMPDIEPYLVTSGTRQNIWFHCFP